MNTVVIHKFNGEIAELVVNKQTHFNDDIFNDLKYKSGHLDRIAKNAMRYGTVIFDENTTYMYEGEEKFSRVTVFLVDSESLFLDTYQIW